MTVISLASPESILARCEPTSPAPSITILMAVRFVPCQGKGEILCKIRIFPMRATSNGVLLPFAMAAK
jgi:hypothetical protein